MRKLSFWWFAALITSGAVLLALMAPWPAKASTASPQDNCPGSCVTLSPTAGPAGTEVTATGSDWPAGDQI
jgi:hypothetical protein